jgi:hypothetical protein
MTAPIRDPRTGRFRKAPRPAVVELASTGRRRWGWEEWTALAVAVAAIAVSGAVLLAQYG